MSLKDGLEKGVIGQPQPVIDLKLRSEVMLATNALAARAKFEILIVSHFLDKTIYNTSDFETIILPFIKHRRASLRILVHESRSLIKESHHLGEMAIRLSSKIEIRQLDSRSQNYNEAWMLCDGVALLHLPVSDMYHGSVDFYTPRRGREYKADFESLWASSVNIPELRALKI